MNPIEGVHRLGQSIWYDNIERKLLKNGELERMIVNNIIRGVTSNPSIFNNAISKSHDYDIDLIPLAKAGLKKEEIYESLAVADIQVACDLFFPLYKTSEGNDGYVSLEVSPYLAKDTDGTIVNAKHLWDSVGRPNLMIKIPGTEEGLPAITQTIAEGINVNVTLIFSIDRYKQVIDAYLRGLAMRLDRGQSINSIASVASFFVSRIDTNVDKRTGNLFKMGKITQAQTRSTQGKIAIANAKLAYRVYKTVFEGNEFQYFKKKGGRNQRTLWASTSTKNPAYPDTMYVDELIGPNTVNTIPPSTLVAFQDHGKVGLTLEANVDDAKVDMDKLAELGISIADITKELEIQGVQSFSDSFTDLLNSIEERVLTTL